MCSVCMESMELMLTCSLTHSQGTYGEKKIIEHMVVIVDTVAFRLSYATLLFR